MKLLLSALAIVLTQTMFIAFLVFSSTCSSKAKAGENDNRDYTFEYRGPEQLKVTVAAEDRCRAYRKAAKMCYNILTGGTSDKRGPYPGEERGLEIIDICSNPLNYKL